MTSHEFRTPLTVIDAAAQRLTRATAAMTPDYLSEKATKIRESVARMMGVMESILAAGQLETGTLSVTRAPCSLRDLIEECAARRREISPSHSIHMHIAHLPDTMLLDRGAMERVFSNLLSNAIKYTPQGGEIRIVADVREGKAIIGIADQGIGIDAEDVPRIFDPYFRARSARGIAGTGIGLNIVREIIKLHGGSIEVSSMIGKGTTFHVMLPVDDDSVAAAS
jgi:signal transduction histidine kinase